MYYEVMDKINIEGKKSTNYSPSIKALDLRNKFIVEKFSLYRSNRINLKFVQQIYNKKNDES